MASETKYVSVIIPTYNRCKGIVNTVESCFKQSYPKNSYEIIVADNNSEDDTRVVIERLQKDSPVPLKYICEPRQGAHHARNNAARQSVGELLYFTDDDMIADSEVLMSMVKVFEIGYNISVVGGRVLPKWEFDPPEWLLKYFSDGTLSLIDKPEKLIVADYDFGIYSCHQMIRKDVMFECGGFNPDIAKNKLLGNGETGLNIKMLNAGYSFGYTSDAVSYHVIPRSRMTQRYINSRYGNQGNCDSFTALRKRANTPNDLISKSVSVHLPNVLKSLMSSLKRQLSGNDSWRLERAKTHYHFHKLKTDLKFAYDKNWRDYSMKYDYLDG